MGYYVSHVLERKDSNGGVDNHEEIDVQETSHKPEPNAVLKPLAVSQVDENAINLSRP
jgi:hypothetical protein